MFKKIGITTLLTLVVLFGGAVSASADTSANIDNHDQGQSHKFYYSVNGDWAESSWDSLNNYLSKCFSKYNFTKWNQQDNYQDVEQPQEEPSQVEQPVEEQPVVEQPAPEENVQTPVEDTQDQGEIDQLSQFEQQVIELTNNERAKQGLAPLKADWELSRVAREKSNDMAGSNYFDHNSPTYGSPFDMMQAYGITYNAAGENIAKGQRTPEEVVNAWMNSQGHRENILNGNFTHIGVGYVEQGNHWTQMFIGK